MINIILNCTLVQQIRKENKFFQVKMSLGPKITLLEVY